MTSDASGLWPLVEPRHVEGNGDGLVETDRNGLEILSREDCLALLSGAALGRIGITQGALPVILPVNFRVIGDRIVFRTGVGTKLDAGTRNAVVAFEVDDMEPLSHTGWSVLAIGRTREVTDPAALEELATANIPRWARSGGDRVIEMSTEMMSGRRIGPAR